MQMKNLVSLGTKILPLNLIYIVEHNKLLLNKNYKFIVYDGFDEYK